MLCEEFYPLLCGDFVYHGAWNNYSQLSKFRGMRSFLKGGRVKHPYQNLLGIN